MLQRIRVRLLNGVNASFIYVNPSKYAFRQPNATYQMIVHLLLHSVAEEGDDVESKVAKGGMGAHVRARASDACHLHPLCGA